MKDLELQLIPIDDKEDKLDKINITYQQLNNKLDLIIEKIKKRKRKKAI